MTKVKEPTFKKLILGDLANHGAIANKIKSIRYRSFAGGDAVDVTAHCLTDVERKILEDVLEPYEYGTFDPMTDCQGFKNQDSKAKRQAKYVHLINLRENEVSQ